MIKIGLGTVQFGLPYGNMALSPLMPLEEVGAILNLALSAGIRFFDTAIAYGESEKRLGELNLAKSANNVEISTKIPSVKEEIWRNEKNYRTFLLDSLSESSFRLKINSFNLLQFHQSNIEFLACKHIQTLMQELVEKGLCKSIGVSVYFPEEAYAALEIPSVSSLQIPVNILDDRFLSEKLLQKYSEKNIRLIARSILMQGILVENAHLPVVKKTEELGQLREISKSVIKNNNFSLEELSLRYVFDKLAKYFDIGLLGIDSAKSFEVNLSIIQDTSKIISDELVNSMQVAKEFADSRGLLNPGAWNK